MKVNEAFDDGVNVYIYLFLRHLADNVICTACVVLTEFSPTNTFNYKYIDVFHFNLLAGKYFKLVFICKTTSLLIQLYKLIV